MIKFAHIRQHDIIGGLYQLVGKGGTTIAYEVNKTSKVININYGVARCSDKDNFAKKTGRELALKRLRESPMVIEVPNDIDTWYPESLLRAIL